MSDRSDQLCLKVISRQVDELDESVRRHVFASHGGSVGRSSSSDWVLPDAERVLSARHAVVEFESGRFYIRDHSTNGTFLNNGSAPIGKGNREPLEPGDRVTLGRYELAVDAAEPDADGMKDLLEGTGRNPEEIAALPEDDPSEAVDAEPSSQPVDLLADEEEFDPLLALDRSRGSGGAAGAETDLGYGAGAADGLDDGRTVDDHAASNAQSFRPPSLIPDDWNPATAVDDAARVPGDPASSEGNGEPAGAAVPRPVKREPPATPAAARASADAALSALLEGLGMEGHSIPEEAVPAFCRSAGQVLRECASGMVAALQARARAKRAFRVSSTQLDVHDNNPLKYAVDADEALFKLFADRRRGYLGPRQAMRAGFFDLIAHERAIRAGTRAVVHALLDDFAPDRVEDAAGSRGGRSLLGPLTDRSRQSYRAYHRARTKGVEDRMIPARFESAFAEAYEAELWPGVPGGPRSHEEES